MRRFATGFIYSLALSLIILGTALTTSASAQNLAALDRRIAALEAEIQRLTGDIERQRFEMRNLKTDLERRLADAELRIQDLEQGHIGGAAATPPANRQVGTPQRQGNQLPGPLGNLVEPQRTPPTQTWRAPSTPGGQQQLGQLGGQPSAATTLYEQAFATLKDGDYVAAEALFTSFLSQYETHRLAENARYWLAETFYVRNQYQDAAREFAKAYRDNPEGSKAPDNLLKLGLSLSSLNQRDDACIALGQLIKEYGNAARSIITRADQEMTRLGC